MNIKKALEIFLVLTVMLCTFTACSSDNSDNVNDINSASVTEEQKSEINDGQNVDLTESVTEVPLEEWGFEHLDLIQNGFVPITSYNLDTDEPYVEFEGSYPNFEFLEYGTVFSGELEKDSQGNLYIEKGSWDASYTVSSNDVYNWDEISDRGVRVIEERIVVTEKNFLVFKMSFGSGTFVDYCIPYSLIDWERGFCDYAEYRGINEYGFEGDIKYFKLYIKQK